MHFKSSVIFHAVYLFTSVWGTGLNRNQMDKCITFHNDHLNEKPKSLYITHLMDHEFKINNKDITFVYDLDKHYYLNMKELFLALAYGGTTDNFKVPTLMPFEVELYLEMFIEHAERLRQQGYLTCEQLVDLFENVNIEKEELSKIRESCDDVSYAVNFLLIMLDILPEGNGLSQEQIEEFIELYKTESYYIDPMEIRKIFKELDMVTKAHVDLMPVKYNRPTGIELMELIVVTAERSKTNNEIVLSTPKVRRLIAKFKKLDINKHGILPKDAAKGFVEEFAKNNPQVSSKNNFDGPFTELPSIMRLLDKELNIAEFLLFHVLY